MKTLILVDFENEYIDPASDYYVGQIEDELKRTNKLIQYCRQEKYKIIFIKHIEEEAGGEFSPNSDNVEIINTLDKRPEDLFVEKNRISAFYQTDLDQKLEGSREIVVAGILTNLCVRSLVQDAYDRDFEITVIKDCCVAFDQDTQEFTFKDLKITRPEINFVDLEDFIK